MEGKPAIVIDNGSGIFKAGFSSEPEPSCVFPNIMARCGCGPIGHMHMGLGPVLSRIKPYYVGDEALRVRGIMNLRPPVERGVVKRWVDMEKVWEYAYERLLGDEEEGTAGGGRKEEHAVVVTEAAAGWPEGDREKVGEVFFERFGCPGLVVAPQGVLAHRAVVQEEQGQKAAVMVSCGAAVTEVVLMHEGKALRRDAWATVEFGGADLDERLWRMLIDRGACTLHTTGEKLHLRHMKEAHCYVAMDFEAEVRGCTDEMERKYEAPDISEAGPVFLREERFVVPEALFSPHRFGMEHMALQEVVHACVGRVDDEALRRALYGSIVVTGGSTLLPGFKERLTKEMEALVPQGVQVGVSSVGDGRTTAWRGGAALGASSAFRDLCVTRQEWNEHGASIMRRK